jgi:hypothetical protein
MFLTDSAAVRCGCRCGRPRRKYFREGALRAVEADETDRWTMKEQSAQLAMLSEFGKSKDLAEKAVTSLRKDERKTDKLRVAFSSALQEEQARARPASPSAERPKKPSFASCRRSIFRWRRGFTIRPSGRAFGVEHRASAS